MSLGPFLFISVFFVFVAFLFQTNFAPLLFFLISPFSVVIVPPPTVYMLSFVSPHGPPRDRSTLVLKKVDFFSFPNILFLPFVILFWVLVFYKGLLAPSDFFPFLLFPVL